MKSTQFVWKVSTLDRLKSVKKKILKQKNKRADLRTFDFEGINISFRQKVFISLCTGSGHKKGTLIVYKSDLSNCNQFTGI